MPRRRLAALDEGHLLAAVATGPVLAFGTSFGAFLGLDLVTRHPGQVSLLVAHEPPVTQLLPEAERARVRELRDEAGAAGQRGEETPPLAEAIGIAFEDREPGVEFSRPTSRQAANDFFFRTRDAPALDRHRLTISALTATRIGGTPSELPQVRRFPVGARKSLPRASAPRWSSFPAVTSAPVCPN